MPSQGRGWLGITHKGLVFGPGPQNSDNEAASYGAVPGCIHEHRLVHQTVTTSIVMYRRPPLSGLCSAVQIGSLVTTQHLVSGTVYVDNNSTIRIENFNYDGLGPGEYTNS